MEIMPTDMQTENPVWLYKDHPNFNRWQKGRELAVERGKFVVSVIEQYKKCENLTILDLGSGEGGTAGYLSLKNKVISADLSLVRLKRQSVYRHHHKINTDAKLLPFKFNNFDIIILQDVIEHIPDNKDIIKSLLPYLKWDGIIYISTPNRKSLINIASDPHWALPIVSLLKREKIKNVFLRNFRKKDYHRKDIAELLSLDEIIHYSSSSRFYLNTCFAIQELFSGNNGIVWSSFHIKLTALLKNLKFDKLLLRAANDNTGFVNNFITPTFYVVLKKK